MTRLQIVRTLYGTGVVLQWGHKTHGFYPLRFIGRWIIRRAARRTKLARMQEREEVPSWEPLGYLVALVIFCAVLSHELEKSKERKT